jgi:hypothetical protein
MKNAPLFPDRFRPYWLLLVVASATAMSLYLLDPYSAPLPRLVCSLLAASAWAAVAFAWDRCLRLNRGLRPGVLLLLATLVLLVTSTLQLTTFRCVPPIADQKYLALEAAIKNKNLDAARYILAHDNQPDYVPTQDSGCYAVEECSNRERPLNTAIRADDAAMAQLLLQHGANPNSVDVEQCRKWSALQLARRQDDIPLAKLLKKAGAREHAAYPQETTCEDGGRE